MHHRSVFQPATWPPVAKQHCHSLQTRAFSTCKLQVVTTPTLSSSCHCYPNSTASLNKPKLFSSQLHIVTMLIHQYVNLSGNKSQSITRVVKWELPSPMFCPMSFLKPSPSMIALTAHNRTEWTIRPICGNELKPILHQS